MKIIVTEPRLIWGPSTHPPGLGPKWLPGENALDPEYWVRVKDRADIKRWLAVGTIRVEQGNAKPLALPKVRAEVPPRMPRPQAARVPFAATTLASLTPAEALIAVGDTLDTKLLAQWYESEDREPVRDAIMARGTALEGD
jgi:hypothetical protein